MEQPLRFQDKIVFISGSSSGIGKATAIKLSTLGFNLIIAGRREERLKLLKYDLESNGVEVCALSFDLRDRTEVDKAIDSLSERWKAIDVLVNNVGVFLPGKLTEEPEGNFEVMLNTNLASTYHLTRALFPFIKNAEQPYIFNICSTASITPYLNGGSYCISKYAQYGLTKVLREELKEYNIRVSAVMPGATLTNSWSGTDLPEQRFIDPNSVAEMIYTAYQLPGNVVLEEILMRPMDGDIS